MRVKDAEAQFIKNDLVNPRAIFSFRTQRINSKLLLQAAAIKILFHGIARA